MSRTVLLGLCFVGFAGVGQAMAQADTFMLVPGIRGSSTDDRHRDWIDVVSLTQTLEQVAGRPQCTLTVVKALDISGPLLWGAAVRGRVFRDIRIEVVSPGDRRQVFYQITPLNASVTGISTNGSGGGYVDGTLGTPVMSSFAC